MRLLPIVALAGCGAQPVLRGRGDPALEARIDRYLAPYVAMKDFAGTVLVAQGDKIVARRTYGGAPEAAPYAVGSIAKTVTAAAVELLAARGKLALADPIGTYVTGLPYGNDVTIAQLLDHRGGVPDYYGFPEFAARHGENLALPELVALIAQKPLDFAPGTDERYSNSGYALLAAAIERTAGEPYGMFVQREVLGPLHLMHSGDLTTGTPPDLAPGRDPGFAPDLVQPASALGTGWLAGNGSLYATADDLLIWTRAAHGKAKHGWGLHDHDGHKVLEQDGRIAGYAAYAGATDDDLVVIVASNIQSQAVQAIGPAIAQIARGKDVAPPATRPSAPPGGDTAFAGRYRVGPGFVLTVAATPRGLTLAGPDGIALPLDREGPHTYFFRPLYTEIGFHDDGSALVWGGAEFPREP